jgi:3D (Asp-Asp-Asp) domain-containing protein
MIGLALKVLVTAFCSCVICTGEFFGLPTSIGVPPKAGITIACDAALLPLGTVVHLDGIGDRVCQTVGGAVIGNHVDEYVDTHERAIDLGLRTARLTVLRLPTGYDFVDGRPVRVLSPHWRKGQ